MSALSRLLRPFDYIRIEHPAKTKYDFYIPLFLAVLFTLGIFLLPVKINIYSKDGLIDVVSGLLQILTGFYIASLAAIATFNKEGMDNVMPGAALTLKVKYKGKDEISNLTRRRFLCLMFGYLSLLSILLYFFGKFSLLLTPNVKLLISITWQPIVYYSFVFIYFSLTFNLLITTLLGLFYMVDRIHRNDPQLVKKGS